MIAFVGCGYAADLYMKARHLHPDLNISGVHDLRRDRARVFAQHYGLSVYNELADLLADDRVEIVLNLTDPRSHFEVSKACLEAGKHVYSEKPLAMTLQEAKALVELAAAKDRWISCAPCSLLRETAQTIWKAVREQVIGPVRMVYAEMDDGMVHLMPYKKWTSETGAPWPVKDEFEVGCTIEHAGYYASWLPAFFGPVRRLVVWGAEQVPDKIPGVELNMRSPDVTVACMEFASGVKARLTCSIIAKHDHKLQVIGDAGTLSTEDCWFYSSPVKLHRRLKIRRKVFYLPWKKTMPLIQSGLPKVKNFGPASVDWFRGVADMAAALKEGRPPRLSPEYSLHVAEIVLAIHGSLKNPGVYDMTTSFDPIDPMPWAH